MPTINNVGNYNKTSDRKVSSKLTFEVGESFKGRVIAKGEGNDVIIRMMDGWQFSAELEGSISDTAVLKLVNFKVEDFEGGKLKLKIIQSATEETNTEDDIVNDFVQKEGMNKTDTAILKAMVNHNIPLTKENITLVKSIINFHEDINNDSGEIDNFIEKYLASKNLSANCEQGEYIKQVLNDFFNSFKDLGQDDIMFFIENNIDLTKENLESYNKLFNSDNTISKYFDDIAKQISDIDMQESQELTSSDSQKNNTIKADVSSKTIQSEEKSQFDNKKVEQTKSGLASKIYESNENSKGKVSILSLLKTLAGEDINLAKESIKEILIQNGDNFTTSEFRNNFAKLNNIDEKKLTEILKNSIGDKNEISDSDVKNIMKNILGKDVLMTKEQINKFKDIIFTKVQLPGNSEKENINNEQISNNINSEELKQSKNVSIQGQENSDIRQISSDIQGIKEKTELIKSDFVAKNSINRTNEDIIKDEIKNKIDIIKDIVKDMVNHAENSSKGMDELMSLIKNNINDFKIFNSISNEYYYADIPVNANGHEYPCKLIIKDNRKDGKQIDKTNVRLVLAVKTINLGTVDGYLKVNNKSLHVDLKCDDNYVNAINKTKDRLVEGLKTLGYIVSISVTAKKEEVNLITCRNFFEEKHDRAIDITV